MDNDCEDSMTVVIFTSNNARILSGVEDITPYSDNPDLVVDPDLTQVRGIPPHYWKLEKGVVVPMSKSERERRDLEHVNNKVDNEIKTVKPKYPNKYLDILLGIAGLVLIGTLVYLRLK